MNHSFPRTKIVATLGPASQSPDMIRQLIRAGMSIARLNFSHGHYDDHARAVANLRSIAEECDQPVTILQDLQGPKVRIGQLPGGELPLVPGSPLILVPAFEYAGEANVVPIDYPCLGAEAHCGATVLLDDGRMELAVERISGSAVQCRVVEGGVLKSRKGVILPTVNLNIPSLTEKDEQDLGFGLSQKVDWIALSFVRSAADVRALKELLALKGASVPVLAKIEKPAAIEHLDEILDEVQGLMVARGDLGVEMPPEQVPLLQKRIIRACNGRGLPVITATQMLESMILEPRPTRAEASDVANAVLDGSDAVMLSGESAVGKFPVRAVEMMARIARDVEPHARFTIHPPAKSDETHALTQAITVIDRTVKLRCIATFTTTGFTARLVSSQRPQAPVVALTPSPQAYHAINLLWGVIPLLVRITVATFEELLILAETTLLEKGLGQLGDRVLIVAGLPLGQAGETSFVKIHTLGRAIR